MRCVFYVLAVASFFLPEAIQAQSSGDYENLEQRFYRSSLTPKDSAAFRKQGEQKVRQLFENGSFYAANQNARANQTYVTQQTQPLFQAVDSDTLNYSALLMQISEANCRGRVKLETQPNPGFLGQTKTLNCTPEVRVDLVLVRQEKKFGKTSEQVWEVLLANPTLK